METIQSCILIFWKDKKKAFYHIKVFALKIWKKKLLSFLPSINEYSSYMYSISFYSFSQLVLGTHYALDPEPGVRAVAEEKGSSLSSRSICVIYKRRSGWQECLPLLSTQFFPDGGFHKALAGSLPLTDMLLQIFKLNVLQEMESVW